jgi:hypothetical protein
MKREIYNAELSPTTEKDLIVSVGVTVKQYSQPPEYGGIYREKYVMRVTSFEYDVLEEDQAKSINEIFTLIAETNTYKEAIGIEIYED